MLVRVVRGVYVIVLAEESQRSMQTCGHECQAGDSQVRRSASRVQSRSLAAGRHELELHETITKARSLTYFQTPSSFVASHNPTTHQTTAIEDLQ